MATVPSWWLKADLHGSDLHVLTPDDRTRLLHWVLRCRSPARFGIGELEAAVGEVGSIGMNLSDDSLLAGMAMGDGAAAAAFVRRYQPRVYGLARTIVGSNAVAEEVAQEAFLRIWRSAAAYDARRGQVGTWVLTITRNLAIDALRLRGNHEQPVEPQALQALIEALLSREGRESRSTHVEDREQLRSALCALPPEQGRLIVLFVVYGLTAQETADLEGVPLGTAKTRIRRGIAKLREALGVSGG
jgi:RNA polymerase sigma factor (sigma-70 family)